MIWVPVTLVASALQTARNAMQAGLVAKIGTLGATQVRFTFGLPFALIFLALVAGVTPIPALTSQALSFAALGACAQIAATALMLMAMRLRSFPVATAIIKTEPALLALFGLLVLGDRLSLAGWAGIGIATAGTLLMSLDKAQAGGQRAIIVGLLAAALFGASAIGFRGAILALPEGSQLARATLILTLTLSMQAAVLGLWLFLFDRAALFGSFRLWRESLGAGFMGAAASQFWFLGFALTAAANVRTLALIEIVMAQVVSRRVFHQGVSAREGLGMALIVLGIGALLLGAR